MTWAAVALAVLAGLAGSVQVAVMGRFGARIGTVEALTFATAVQLLLAGLILLAVRQGTGGLGGAFRSPPWLWAGGLMGLLIVFTVTFAQPRIGATATIGILIAGQLAMGAAIDRFGLFGVDQIAISWPRAARHRPARGRRSTVARQVSPRGKMWTALWAVYIIWGSTYLAIAVAGETIPPLLAVSTRFVFAGAIMAAVVSGAARRCASRAARFASCALVGCLLPGANAVLFFAEREVPIGVASLLIASVPLLVVVLRLLGRERLPASALAGVGVGFVGVAILAQPSSGASVGGIAALHPLGDHVGGRLGRIEPAADAGRPVHRDRLGDARRRRLDAPVRNRDGRLVHSVGVRRSSRGSTWSRSARWSATPPTSGCSRTHRSASRLDLCLREPGRGDHPRRPLPRRGPDGAGS